MNARLQAKQLSEEQQRKSHELFAKSAEAEKKLRTWMRIAKLGERVRERGIQTGDMQEQVRGQKIADRGNQFAEEYSLTFEIAWEKALAAEALSAAYYQEYEQRELHE